MTHIHVAGVGMTRFGKHPDRSVKDLVGEALSLALADAGCGGDAIEAAFFGNCLQGYMDGQDMIRGQAALRAHGLQGIPIVNVENACATGASALHLAANYVRSGAADIVLAIGVEKMFSDDKAKMFASFEGAKDIEEGERFRLFWERVGLADGEAGDPGNPARSVFMDVYGGFARMHMKLFGTTQHQIATVASKNHGHSVFNPLAQFTRPFTVEEVLAGTAVVHPLTVPMCSPISDGAAAAIVCSERGLRRIEGAAARSIRLLASVLRSGSHRPVDDLEHHVSRLAARDAYDQAGLGPRDVDVAEVHDATAVGEIIETEALGFCAIGEGGLLAERGETALGGRIPINPSGGLECRGHPIGATGLAQAFELVTQLRGEAGGRQVEGARVALAQNGGGILGPEEAIVGVTLFGK